MNNKELFLNTIKGKVYDKKPIWFMRQAGRFLKSYRTLREQYDFLTMCTTPELAAKVTILPKNELDVDAMILFSDILIPLIALNAKISYKNGVSPSVENLNPEDITTITPDINKLNFISNSIKLIKNEIKDTALIGFAAAPFTLGCYLFGSGGDFFKIRSFIYDKPKEFLKIMDSLSNLTIKYLNMQIEAGVDAIQLFDSWAGIVPYDIYETFIFPFNQEIAKSITTPSIYYIKNSAHINDIIIKLDFDCLSVDWRQDLVDLHKKSSKCVQGNIDNTLLLANRNVLKDKTEALLRKTKNIPHIFNLGHGILPQTDEDTAKYLVDLVHSFN